ncbi:TOMM precursor leader peptide-binding protein [Streptomyces sp. NPDC001941]|uniref:TOMM precursor leader peptide-binding protein n=1 Tax=Streptomyces sp. NPDC001941 TaxID=3154659 RepID=UPI00332C2832
MTVSRTPLHTVWTGDFGREVAVRLASLTGAPHDRTDPPATGRARWPHAGLRVVAAWRGDPALFEELAAYQAALGVPWLPVVHEFPAIRVGPLVVPGRGPCHGCYVRRRAQHDRSPGTRTALRASAERDAGAGVRGFTAAQAMVAAGLAGRLIADSVDDRGAHAGTVLVYDVLTRGLLADTVLGVHGCAECGTPPHPDDGWRHLADDLAAPARVKPALPRRRVLPATSFREETVR